MRVFYPLVFALIALLKILQVEAECCSEQWTGGSSACKGRGCNWICCKCSYCDRDFRGYVGLGGDAAWGIGAAAAIGFGIAAVCAAPASAAAMAAVWATSRVHDVYIDRRKRQVIWEEGDGDVTVYIVDEYPDGYYTVQDDCETYYKRRKRDIGTNQSGNCSAYSHAHENSCFLWGGEEKEKILQSYFAEAGTGSKNSELLIFLWRF